MVSGRARTYGLGHRRASRKLGLQHAWAQESVELDGGSAALDPPYGVGRNIWYILGLALSGLFSAALRLRARLLPGTPRIPPGHLPPDTSRIPPSDRLLY
jgi:hypothetical protein